MNRPLQQKKILVMFTMTFQEDKGSSAYFFSKNQAVFLQIATIWNEYINEWTSELYSNTAQILKYT